MAFPFAELRNALVGRRLDVVVRPPARAGVRAGGPDLSRCVVGRRERRSRRRPGRFFPGPWAAAGAPSGATSGQTGGPPAGAAPTRETTTAPRAPEPAAT